MKKLSLFAIIVAFLASCAGSEFDGPSVPEEEKSAKVVLSKASYLKSPSPLNENYEGRRIIIFVISEGDEYSSTEATATADDLEIPIAVPQDGKSYTVYVYMPDDPKWQPRQNLTKDSGYEEDDEKYISGELSITAGFSAYAGSSTNKEAIFYVTSLAVNSTGDLTALAAGVMSESVSFTLSVSEADVANDVIVFDVENAKDNILDTDDVKVTYLVNDETVATLDKPPFQYDLIVADFNPGTYAVTALVENSEGHVGKSTGSFTISAGDAPDAPTISDISPGNGTEITAGTEGYTLQANAAVDDPNSKGITISKVEFFVNGSSVGTAEETGNPYTTQWNVPSTVGGATITIKATDSEGSISERSVRVQIIEAPEETPEENPTVQ